MMIFKVSLRFDYTNKNIYMMSSRLLNLVGLNEGIAFMFGVVLH